MMLRAEDREISIKIANRIREILVDEIENSTTENESGCADINSKFLT